MVQKESQEGFKLIKVRKETYEELSKLINKIEKRQPYLKGLVGFNAVIQMLLLKNSIKLSKYRYLKVKK